MIKKYVKKPIVVEVIQWTGDNLDEITDFAGNIVSKDVNGHLVVNTLEGNMVSPNKTHDYVIKGIDGEFYICEKSIFEKTYECIDDDRSYVCSQMMY